MNCQDVTNLLDNGQQPDLTPAQREDLGEHFLTCENCQSAWRASRLLRSFAEVPTPSPRASLLDETMRRAAATAVQPLQRSRSSWLRGALGAALAASIAVMAVIGTLPPSGPGSIDATPAMEIALFESRDITLSIDSAERLADAQIHVVLTGGIELAGRKGQKDIRWNTDIDAGINRLTIPVVAVSGEEAELLVEVEHGSRHRRFLMSLAILSARDAEAPVTG